MRAREGVAVAGRTSEGFAELVELRSAALQRTAYLLVGDPALAEELVREALVRTCLAWPRLRDPFRAESFARSAIATLALTRSPGEPRPAPDTDREDDERAWLWHCLLRLPVRQRAAIVLLHHEGLSEREAAETLRCSVGTVRSELAAGLATLRPLVGDDLLPREATG
jgi:RNA polymerase sigma factor (sigma-70 family)